VFDLDPALPESLLGDRLCAGGKERFGDGDISPSELVRALDRVWLEGKVLYVVGGIGVNDFPFFKLPTIWVARFEPETEKQKSRSQKAN